MKLQASSAQLKQRAAATQASDPRGRSVALVADMLRKRADLGRFLRRQPVAEIAARIVDGLVAHRHEGKLDLNWVTGDLAPLVARMPPEVWKALGAGVQEVELSADLTFALAVADDETLREGMQQLPGLRELTLCDAPADRRIDLVELTGAAPVAVHLRFTQEVPVIGLDVADGTTVDAQARGVAAQKSRVTFHRLGGAAYTRTLQELVYKSTSRVPQLQDRSINLNMVGRYPSGDLIACRDLVLFWHTLRQQHREVRSGPFSYAPLAERKAIEDGIGSAVAEEYLRMHEAGAEALFGTAEFGNLLADEFARMPVGQTAQLVVDTDNHSLGIELAVKPGAGAPEYVVNLYDPNRTVLHTRMVLADPGALRGKALEDWAAQGGMDEYFEDEPRICALYRRGANAASSDRDFIRYVPEDDRLSGQVLANAMQEGRLGPVTDCLAAAQDACDSGRLEPAQLRTFVTARFMDVPAMKRALAFGRTEVVREIVDWVMSRSGELLTPRQCGELLLAEHRGETGLHMAGMNNRAETVAMFSEAVAAAQVPQTLLAGDRFGLLLARGESGEPLLHAMATQALEPQKAAARAETAFVHMRAIAASALSTEDKVALCAATHGDPATPCARAALDANRPQLAAAMARGIIEGESDAGRASLLLTSLGVGAEELLQGLKQADDTDGLALMVGSLHRWGLPPADTEKLRARYSQG